MHHRFQLNSAAQTSAALITQCRPRSGQTPFTVVDGEEQRSSGNCLSTLEVNFLKLPQNILQLLPPAAYRHNRGKRFPEEADCCSTPSGQLKGLPTCRCKPCCIRRACNGWSATAVWVITRIWKKWSTVYWKAPGVPKHPEDDYGQQILNVVQRVTVDEMIIRPTPTKLRRSESSAGQSAERACQ